jgi:penicillin amidase
MDTWIKEVLNLTFEELNVVPAAKNNLVLFNVLLHGLNPGGGIQNNYDWFQNSDPTAPQTAEAIIVKALDNTLATLGPPPWGTDNNPITKHQTRGVITYSHTVLKQVVHQMPFSSRSTYAHTIEYARSGPVELQSMFPLGESGTILGTYPGQAVFDTNFLSMTPVFDWFGYRNFPFKP